jgi:hypothetical protein
MNHLDWVSQILFINENGRSLTHRLQRIMAKPKHQKKEEDTETQVQD